MRNVSLELKNVSLELSNVTFAWARVQFIWTATVDSPGNHPYSVCAWLYVGDHMVDIECRALSVVLMSNHLLCDSETPTFIVVARCCVSLELRNVSFRLRNLSADCRLVALQLRQACRGG